MSTPISIVAKKIIICGLFAGLLSSCGKKEKGPKVAESEVNDDTDEPVYYYLAEENFDYVNGRLEGNRTPLGFLDRWDRSDHDGETSVSNGVARIKSSLRMISYLDTSPDGPFNHYVDGKGKIGRNGSVLYISFYQKILTAQTNRVSLVQFGNSGPGDRHLGNQFSIGMHEHPKPGGTFGLLIRNDPKKSILAPEPINEHENLIVLRIRYGEQDKDRISYYYNPTVEDERRPAGSMMVEDLSIGCYTFACFRGGEMSIRRVRFADTFKAVAIDIY